MKEYKYEKCSQEKKKWLPESDPQDYPDVEISKHCKRESIIFYLQIM